MRKALVIASLCVLMLTAASLTFAIEVTGRVVDSAGNGLGQARVDFRAAKSDDGEFAATAWTDDRGYFTAELSQGEYQVTVTKSLSEVANFSVTVDEEKGMTPDELKADF